MAKKLISCLILFAFMQIGCNSKNNKKVIDRDTSIIVIRHEECTECFDAVVDSGDLKITKLAKEEVRKCYVDDSSFKHANYTLKLRGEKNISDILFGDSTTFIKLWKKKYLIKGYVMGVESCAFVFYVTDYREYPTFKNFHSPTKAPQPK